MYYSKNGHIYYYKRYSRQKKTPSSKVGLFNEEECIDRKNPEV